MLTRGLKPALLVVLGLLLQGCGGKSNLWKQSDFPQAERFPYAAKVLDPVNGKTCSAVLLGPGTVLTAAHCLSQEGKYVVVAPSGTSSAHEIARLGDGTVSDGSDLALLSTNDALSAATYPAIGSGLKEGEKLTFVGFGCTETATKTGGGAMQVGENQIISLGKFALTLTPKAAIRGIVGAEGERALCSGDSGGPAFRKRGDELELVALGHAASELDEGRYSLFVNLTQRANRDFLAEQSEAQGLAIRFSP